MSLKDTPQTLIRDLLPDNRLKRKLIKEVQEGGHVLVRLESDKGSIGYWPLNLEVPKRYKGVKPAYIGKKLDYFSKSNKKQTAIGG